MHDHDLRWYALVPTAILFCFVELLLETFGVWFRFPVRPNWLWCLAFFAVLRVPAAPAVFAFAVIGLTRDFFLGPKMGAGMLAFIIAGWFALYWRLLATVKGVSSQMLVAGATAFLASLAKHSLDYGPQAYTLAYRILFISLGDAALTAVLYLPLSVFLAWKPFRPWRERGIF